MLIGPSYTLAQIEEQMNNKISENKMQIKSISTELSRLHQEYNSLPRIKNEPPTTNMVEVVNRIKEIQSKMEELTDQCEKLAGKLEEAEKDPNKKRMITLTLRDCVDLGFE